MTLRTWTTGPVLALAVAVGVMGCASASPPGATPTMGTPATGKDTPASKAPAPPAPDDIASATPSPTAEARQSQAPAPTATVTPDDVNDEQPATMPASEPGHDDEAEAAPIDGGHDESSVDSAGGAEAQSACDGTVPNDAAVIPGPSGPDGPDNDSVFRSLTVHPTDPNTIFLGTERHGFVRSTDGGSTWTRHREGLRVIGTMYAEIWDIAFSPADPAVMLAATLDSPGPTTGSAPSVVAGVYRSTDGGETWKQVNCGLPSSRANSVRVPSHGPGHRRGGPGRRAAVLFGRVHLLRRWPL